jgi:acetoin utilization protein AcuB
MESDPFSLVLLSWFSAHGETDSGGAMQVRDVMQAEVETVRLGSSAREAFEMMRLRGFRHLPVLSSDDKIVGIVSDRDLRNAVVIYTDPKSGAEDFFASEDTTVDKLMASDPVSVKPDDDIASAVRLMREQNFGCLVVSENDHLVGILSYVDLLDVLLGLLEAPNTT